MTIKTISALVEQLEQTLEETQAKNILLEEEKQLLQEKLLQEQRIADFFCAIALATTVFFILGIAGVL